MNAFIGEIRAFPYTFVPDGWLPCDGSEVSVNMYQALNAVIGNNYGIPSSNQVFKLPNIQGRVVVGVDNRDMDFYTVGKTGGSISVGLSSISQIPAHSHAINGYTHNPQTETSFVSNTPGTSLLLSNPTTKPATGMATMQKCYTNTKNTPVEMNYNSITPAGASEVHENRQPYLTFRWGINIDGSFPVRQ